MRELLYAEQCPKPELHGHFKELCYHRGAVVTKAGQKPLSPEVLEEEKARGFARRGVFRRKLRCFTDGLGLGTESKVLEVLVELRQEKEIKGAALPEGGIQAARKAEKFRKRVGCGK